MGQSETRPPAVDPIREDILSGMDALSVKRKHGLSDDELQAAYQQCSGPQDPAAHEQRTTWSCPACGVTQSHAMEECPRCGIVVSKFSDRKLVDAHCRPIRANRHTDSSAGHRTTWITVVVSVLLCLALGGALLKWTGGTHREEVKLTQGPEQVSSGLKRFTYENLEQEVVAVSKTQPVIVEFYSSN
jgi:hypothetical protein